MDSTKQLHFSEIKHKVDALMDLLFGAGVASHHTIIEQINYLMFLRALTKKDDEAMLIDAEDKQLFKGKLAQYRWDNLLMLNAEALFITLEELYRKLPELILDRTIALLYRDAHVKVFDKPTLRRLLHEIEKLMSELEIEAHHGYNDIFGDMYEYLLSKLSQSGTMGSFRRPRHIIKFIVDVIDPVKGETILDPACGTAGFLVAALENIKRKYTSSEFKEQDKYPMDLLSPNELNFLLTHTFTGFDSDQDMIKFGLMNLYLHHLEHPNIKRQNTLVDTAGDRTKWDVILANPPFAGAIDLDSISQDLRMGTRATEILFLRYMIDHLRDSGRAGVIVPEGIIFSNSTAHKKIRQILVDDAGLWCVVSLPAGIFNPYAGVKTSVLFFDKSLKEKTKNILFVKIENDGFDLGAQKRPIDKNDLPQSLDEIKKYKEFLLSGNTQNDLFLERIKENGKAGEIFRITNDKLSIVAKKIISEYEDYNLSSERYKIENIIVNTKWPLVNLDTVLSLEYGKALPENKRKEGPIDVVGSNGVVGKHNEFLIKGPSIIVGRKGSAGEVVWIDNDNYPIDTTYYVKIKDISKLDLRYAYYILKSLKLSKLRNGGGVPGLNRNDAYKLKIPLPPLEIQQQIVKELDSYQKIISGAKQVVENWKPFLSNNSNWQTKRLNEIAEIIMGQSPPGNSYNNEGKGIPLINGPVEFGPSAFSFTIKSKYTTKPTKYCKQGDLILCVRGSTTGRMNIAGFDACIGRGVAAIRSLKYQKYLYYYINSYRQKLYLLGSGSTFPNISQDDIKNLSIYLPQDNELEMIVNSLEEEKRIVENNNRLIEIYEQKTKDKIAEVWNQ